MSIKPPVTVFLRQALDDAGEFVSDPGRDAAAMVMLNELARLTAALAPLPVTA
ncbi:hypothetical protein ACLQ22_01460 [Micromonospora sp. DT178]|uniref:hypothetical protein n=1 Tax=Micromonospora sp. DT178 TaxID=3393436 RepID=UPI003CF1546B